MSENLFFIENPTRNHYNEIQTLLLLVRTSGCELLF